MTLTMFSDSEDDHDLDAATVTMVMPLLVCRGLRRHRHRGLAPIARRLTTVDKRDPWYL